MYPDGKTIRNLLVCDAAQVRVPEDMWQNISQRLDQEREKAAQRREWRLRLRLWKPAVALVAASALFWIPPPAPFQKGSDLEHSAYDRSHLVIHPSMQDIPVDLMPDFTPKTGRKSSGGGMAPNGSRNNMHIL